MQHEKQVNNDLSVIITGASRGLGLDIARVFNRQTENLSLIASSEASFESVKGEFRNATFHNGDFADESNLRRIASELNSERESCDVLINNCGVYEQNEFANMSLPAISRMIDINVKAPILLTRMLIDQLKNGRRPIVINISSIQTPNPTVGHSVYAASKGALTTFSQVLRQEFNPLGIRVTVLHPSAINTWGAENNEGLLSTKQVSDLIIGIVNLESNMQIQEITISDIKYQA